MRLLSILFLLCWACWVHAQPVLSVVKGPSGKHAFEAKNISEDLIKEWGNSNANSSWWKKHFAIRVEGASQSLFGDYNVNGQSVTFEPRFPLDPAVKYVASLEGVELIYQIERDVAPSKVLTVSPSGAVPENLLRFYINFSNPMGLSNPFDYVSLLDANGTEIKDAFVEVPEGLWNADRTRLTILLHPGRIKQGVGPNEIQGAVIERGGAYTLLIKEGWKDNSGLEVEPMQSVWEVTDPVRSKIDLEKWVFERGKDQIKIQTDRILDAEMINQKLSVRAGDQVIKGYWKLNSTQLLFAPDDLNNLNEELELRINPTLEDVSGNTLLNSFDSKVDRTKLTHEPIVIRF